MDYSMYVVAVGAEPAVGDGQSQPRLPGRISGGPGSHWSEGEAAVPDEVACA